MRDHTTPPVPGDQRDLLCPQSFLVRGAEALDTCVRLPEGQAYVDADGAECVAPEPLWGLITG